MGKYVQKTYLQRFVRRHNRQIHKANTAKGGMRKRNQSVPIIKGFRLFDHVFYKGQECFIFGKRTSGYFDLRTLDGTVIHRTASWKPDPFYLSLSLRPVGALQ